VSVESIIAAAESSANGFADSATKALDDASQAAKTINKPNRNELGYNDPSQLPRFDYKLPPLTAHYQKPNNQNTPPSFSPTQPLPPPNFPAPVVIDTAGLFKNTKPAYNEVTLPETAPNTDIASISAEINAINKPDIYNPEVPQAIAVTIPTAPSVNLPTFNAIIGDTYTGNAPDTNAAFLNQYQTARPEIQAWVDSKLDQWISVYAPTLKTDLATLQAKVNNDMASGKALSVNFETALYNRARSKVSNELNRVKHEVVKGMSKRGFTLPPSALSAGLVNASQAASDNIAQQATEIAIERAKMEIQHVQFVMNLSNNIQQSLLGNAMQYLATVQEVNRQCIDLSKQVAINLNEMYNNRFKVANLAIEVFNAESRVYEVELKSALSRLDEYKLQIEAVKLQKDIEKTDIELYKARIEGENTKISQYLSLVEAVSKKASLEKTKVEIFGEQVKAYVAQVQGEEAKFKVYATAIAGDEAKVKGELAKVEAYSKQVDAEAIKSKLFIANNESIIAGNKNQIDLQSFNLNKYKIDVEAEKTNYLAGVEGYKARMIAVSENNRMQQEYFKAQYSKAALALDFAKTKFEGNIKQALEATKLNIEQMKVQADTGVSVGKVYGSMAGAALSSQNTMTSLSTTQ